jgi:hypothetical protein
LIFLSCICFNHSGSGVDLVCPEIPQGIPWHWPVWSSQPLCQQRLWKSILSLCHCNVAKPMTK